MKKALTALAVFVLAFSFLTGCGAQYKDGIYHAEFADYDEHGWKEYVDVQVEGEKVTVLTFDGINAEGKLKSSDESYRSSMESVEGTYPSKFYSDITNQYLESGKLKEVATVAGATISTDHFKTLMAALESNFTSGNTSECIVDASASSKSK